MVIARAATLDKKEYSESTTELAEEQPKATQFTTALNAGFEKKHSTNKLIATRAVTEKFVEHKPAYVPPTNPNQQLNTAALAERQIEPVTQPTEAVTELVNELKEEAE